MAPEKIILQSSESFHHFELWFAPNNFNQNTTRFLKGDWFWALHVEFACFKLVKDIGKD